MEKWGAWIEGLREAMINPGTPLGSSKSTQGDKTITDTKYNDRLVEYSVTETGTQEVTEVK